MKVFFSYSGVRSKSTAEAFSDLLKRVFPDVSIFGMQTDIAVGDMWRNALEQASAESEMAFVFLTRENMDKPWINFEMGYLKEKVNNIIPFLVDFPPSELAGPLSQFQALRPQKEDVYNLFIHIYEKSNVGMENKDALHSVFERNWWEFERRLSDIKKRSKPPIVISSVVGESNIVVGGSTVNVVSGPGDKDTDIKEISSDQAFERIGTAVRQNLDQIKQDIEQARSESSQFFKLTIIFSSIGFAIVAVAIVLLIQAEITAGIVASIASIVPEVTALLFFKKDKELRGTIEQYHKHVLESQKLLTMVDVCETILDASERDKMKQKIILSALDVA
ncbi:toll/interleukin-1 receptor domain-containing protein [Prosthecochloris sp.]|uniref:toll/interleukin-1 receptor domain-containing protein n=1 Tax=Prosthecochloris sp. TaxID=290513 RepID=UPI0025806FDA|nr:toll/interleukin-1 receptor domain-containing protein [Prosthecochloris sp.]